MAIVDENRPGLPVPFAMEPRDRGAKGRYLDADFFRLEAENLWSRTWQMACRLEEIPQPYDFATYEILDQSVILIRQQDGTVKAVQNACRHRGVQVAQGRGTCESGFTCPFHGWCYGPDGHNTAVTSNHISHLDAPILFDALDLDVKAIVKKEIFGWPFLGRVLKEAGFVAVDRTDRVQVALRDPDAHSSDDQRGHRDGVDDRPLRVAVNPDAEDRRQAADHEGEGRREEARRPRGRCLLLDDVGHQLRVGRDGRDLGVGRSERPSEPAHHHDRQNGAPAHDLALTSGRRGSGSRRSSVSSAPELRRFRSPASR